MARVVVLSKTASQEFGLFDHIFRLDYNYLANRWSRAIFDKQGNPIISGDFFDVGDNIAQPIGKKLVLRDFAPCPNQDWYYRMTERYLDGRAESGLVIE